MTAKVGPDQKSVTTCILTRRNQLVVSVTFSNSLKKINLIGGMQCENYLINIAMKTQSSRGAEFYVVDVQSGVGTAIYLSTVSILLMINIA